MKREDLIKSNEYVVTGFQLSLLNLMEEYMKKRGFNRNQLAAHLGVTKGYISQLLNATFDHKISKLVELALACGKMPMIYFVDIDTYLKVDANDKVYDLMVVHKPKLVTFDNRSSQKPAKSNTKKQLAVKKKKKVK